MTDRAPFTVQMSIRQYKGANDRGYANYENIASFDLDAQVGKAFSVFQAALEDLSSDWTHPLIAVTEPPQVDA